MDNSGRGPLRVPGFSDIPVNFQLPTEQRFAHGFLEWRQSPPLTAQEIAMVALMEWLTDKPSWFEDVLNDGIVAQWREEFERERSRFTWKNPRLLRGERTWDWCVQELRDKAIDFGKKHYVRVLDTGSCVFKVDPTELASSSSVLRRSFWMPIEEYTRKVPAKESPSAPQHSSQQLVCPRTDDRIDPDYKIDRGWRPRYGGDRNGCAPMITALVDPLMFPLVYGRTMVLQQGGTVDRNHMFESYGAAQEAPPAPRPLAERDIDAEEPDDGSSLYWLKSESSSNPWSQRYQSLPCEVAFTSDDGGGKSCSAEETHVGVTITSYINGLHPCHTDVYRAIEQVLSRSIQPWNECLIRGHHGMHNLYHMGQLGPVPARIITFGVLWENEMPEWTTAFRILSAEHDKLWHEEYEKLQQPDTRDGEEEEWMKRSRLRKLRHMEEFLAKPVAKELPPRDSDLWQRAKEYLEQSEPPSDNNAPLDIADWAVGEEMTWNYLWSKAERLVRFKHPEPGAAFSYQEWKEGRHGSRPIVGPILVEPVDAGEDYIHVVPPHEGFSVALQDSFWEQGLQVIVGVSSIDLTPETPAYAPEIFDREAVHRRWTAKEFGKAKSGEAVAEDVLAWDEDGWQLAGQRLNDHVVGVAILAFEVDNISEPRLEFRQPIGETSCHRYDECREPDWAPYYYYAYDGPAHLIGKLKDATALAETLGAPWFNFDTDIPPCQYQQIGSVGLSQDRLVVFPNVLEHRLSPFRLVDETKPGRIRWLTLSLVDPHYRVCSTRNVPPQQHDWWAREARALLLKAGNLPMEVVDQILAYTDDWPMGIDEVMQHRVQMADEGGLDQKYEE